MYDRAKACMYANGAYFELKKVCLPRVSSSFKKISPKAFGPYCLCTFVQCTRMYAMLYDEASFVLK